MKLKKLVMDAYNNAPSVGVCKMIRGGLFVSSSYWPQDYSVKVIEGDITKNMVTIKDGTLPSFCHRLAVVDRERNLVAMGDYTRFCVLSYNGQVKFDAWRRQGRATKYNLPTKVIWFRYFWEDFNSNVFPGSESDLWEYESIKVSTELDSKKAADAWIQRKMNSYREANCINRKIYAYIIDRPPQSLIDYQVLRLTQSIEIYQQELKRWSEL